MDIEEMPEQDPKENHTVETVPETTASAVPCEHMEEVPAVLPPFSPLDGVSENMKTFKDVAMQTEPLLCSPIIVTPGTKRKQVEQDHSYCKKKLEFSPVHTEASLMPTTVLKDEDLDESSSDDEFDKIDETGTDYNSDTSDEDWVPDEEELDSVDENPVNYDQNTEVETNWLQETDELLKEKKSIVFDSRPKQLFRRCQKCGANVKCASLKQRGSLICVTSSCENGHTENWFSQTFTTRTATGNLVCSGGILFTGGHFASTSAFMNTCNIRFFKSNFNSIQRKYL